MSSSKVSLRHIASQLGVSVKTVSGALHNRSIRMSDETRERIRKLAEELGYKPNLVARGMRQGALPIVGLIGEGLITQPFATEIMRSLDNVLRAHGLSVLVTDIGGQRGVEHGIAEIQRLMPSRIAYASMYHRAVPMPPQAGDSIELLINCRAEGGRIPALVPAEEAAGFAIASHLIERGRRAIAFLNLPGLLAGELRAQGFRRAHAAHGLAVEEGWLAPATRGPAYTDRAHSLVYDRIGQWMAAERRPDAILCGNDRIALEVYGALRRGGWRIPQHVSVASFDNQVEIAARLDPPLTTMALPHREMGRRAGEILAGVGSPPEDVEEIPFRLVERASV